MDPAHSDFPEWIDFCDFRCLSLSVKEQTAIPLKAALPVPSPSPHSWNAALHQPVLSFTKSTASLHFVPLLALCASFQEAGLTDRKQTDGGCIIPSLAVMGL